MTEDNFEEANDFINFLIESGALEVHGIDPKTEDFTYMVTEKMKDLVPEFYEEHFKFINQVAFNLWQKGYVEIKFEENGPLIMLIKGLDYKKIIDTLPEEERYLIENMINLNDGII